MQSGSRAGELEFVRIPAGEFVMGSSVEYAAEMAKQATGNWYRESPPSEAPPRTVEITRSFDLGKTEVTLEQFQAFVESTGYLTDAERDSNGASGWRDGKWVENTEGFNWREMGIARAADEPVVNVTWNDAIAFCDWMTKQTGVKHRLPTEAEWEYACRSGSPSVYFWGDDPARRHEYAWSIDNSGGKPQAVGQLKPNAFGLYDMLGNVYEYCADGWSTNIPQALGQPASLVFIDPQVASDGPEADIVVRSTSWGTNPLHCRSAFRGSAGKTHRNHRDGFRVLREVLPK
jgi:formylglycine-generating enzyme required for sulfatase activity